jgi:nitrogen fixation NifU-like protein
MDRLGGLPQRKFHCSVLCDKALRDAINDFYRRTNQIDKIIVEAYRIIDPISKVTDHDIEEARVNFRWGPKQVEVVKRAAALIGVPYQTYMKEAIFRQAIADIEAAKRALA